MQSSSEQEKQGMRHVRKEYKHSQSIVWNISQWIGDIFPSRMPGTSAYNCTDCSIATMNVLLGKPLQPVKAKPENVLTAPFVVNSKDGTLERKLSTEDAMTESFLYQFISHNFKPTNKNVVDPIESESSAEVRITKLTTLMRKATRDNLAASIISDAPRNNEDINNPYCPQESGFGFVGLMHYSNGRYFSHLMLYYLTPGNQVYFLEPQLGSIYNEIPKSYLDAVFWYEVTPVNGFQERQIYVKRETEQAVVRSDDKHAKQNKRPREGVDIESDEGERRISPKNVVTAVARAREKEEEKASPLALTPLMVSSSRSHLFVERALQDVTNLILQGNAGLLQSKLQFFPTEMRGLLLEDALRRVPIQNMFGLGEKLAPVLLIMLNELKLDEEATASFFTSVIYTCKVQDPKPKKGVTLLTTATAECVEAQLPIFCATLMKKMSLGGRSKFFKDSEKNSSLATIILDCLSVPEVEQLATKFGPPSIIGVRLNRYLTLRREKESHSNSSSSTQNRAPTSSSQSGPLTWWYIQNPPAAPSNSESQQAAEESDDDLGSTISMKPFSTSSTINNLLRKYR